MSQTMSQTESTEPTEPLQEQNDRLTRELAELREEHERLRDDYRKTDAKLTVARSLLFDIVDQIDDENGYLRVFDYECDLTPYSEEE